MNIYCIPSSMYRTQSYTRLDTKKIQLASICAGLASQDLKIIGV